MNRITNECVLKVKLLYSEYSEGRYVAGTARLAVAGIATAAAFVPVVGWAIAGSIILADSIWGDSFYNDLQNEYGN